jgi:mono/diheme cytochrome c family protein
MRVALLTLVAAGALLVPPVALADAVGLVVSADGARGEVRVDGPDGVLTSDATRLDGLITEDDFARGDYEVVEVDDPAQTVRQLEERIDRNDRWRTPLTILLAALVIGLALVRPAWALRAVLVALAANLWLSPALALAAGLATLALPLGFACAAVLAVYLASMGLDAETVALSPFGPSQVNRFYGINNLLETMLLAPALVGAALLGRAGVAVAALALVTVGGNRFGADGGGIAVLAAAYLVLWWRLRGTRPQRRHVVLALAAVATLVALDAATGGSSHVTDALRDGPVSLVGDLADRVERSVSRTLDSPGALAVVLGSLAVLAGVAAKAPRTPVLVAFLAGLAVSLVVNDTPSDVLGMGAAIALALARHTPGRRSVSSLPMRRAALLLALLAFLALGAGLAGCGGGETETATPETIEGEPPEAGTTEEESEAPDVEGDAEAGAGVFDANGCGSCHTLDAAGSSGSIGPNLDEAQPDFALAFQTVQNGRGAMPAFKDQLSEQQIADVAQFVADSTS